MDTKCIRRKLNRDLFQKIDKKRRLVFIFLVAVLLGLLRYFSHYGSSLKDGGFQNFQKSSKTRGKMTVTCKLPRLQPIDTSEFKDPAEPKRLDCKKKYPLIFKTDLNQTLVQVVDPSELGMTDCCYTPFERKSGNEEEVVYSDECVPITENFTLIPPPIEFIRINCTKEDESIPVDFFGFILPKNTNSQSQPNSDSTSENPENAQEKLNVLILGFDSISHMNFMRTMPLSYRFLTRNLSGIGMSGFSKLAENTFPNLVPALIGKTVEEIERFCWNKTSHVEDCPFIWKKAKEQGYLTAYGEDATWMGNFVLEGMPLSFSKDRNHGQGFDYFYNTLTSEMSTQIGYQRPGNAYWCYGPKLSFTVLLGFVKKMAFTMHESQTKTHRYFQFIWAQALLHDYLNAGKFADQILYDTLKYLKQSGYLNNTALILMSDHGMRFGDFRATFQGRLEERMPLLYFAFPRSLSSKPEYQTALRNLKNNAKRLTTHFDLHETLLDLLFLQNITNDKILERQHKLSDDRENQNKSQHHLKKPHPRGISLFLPIPLDRTCEDAEIPQHFCICDPLKEIPVEENSLVLEAAKNVVQFINGQLTKFPQCEILKLKQVRNAQISLKNKSPRIKMAGLGLDSNSNLNSNSNPNLEIDSDSETYSEFDSSFENSDDPRLSERDVTFLISLTVSPSDASFDARITRQRNGAWITSKEISRTNLFRNQSWCISREEFQRKTYCYCKHV